MLGKLAVVLLLLTAMGSAEMIAVGNYTFTFDMDRLHVIEDRCIKTFDGKIIIGEGSIDEVSAEDLGARVGYVESEDDFFELYRHQYNAAYTIDPEYRQFYMISTMNLTDTIDFLKTLKVEPIQ